jgi:hypothetical protein
LLTARDPLSQRVQLATPAVVGLTLLGMFRGASRRLGRRFTATTQKPRGA